MSVIDKKTLLRLREWFFQYSGSFFHEDPVRKECIELKISHTLKVCALMKGLAESMNLPEQEMNLAEVIALFHDIGRFEQLMQYGTFLDSKSVNHAELGVKILKEKEVFKGIDEKIQDIIFSSISCHNRLELPKEDSAQRLFFSRMIRDADKLDIYAFSTNRFFQKDIPHNDPILLEMPDLPDISEEICQDLLSGTIVKQKKLKTLNDLKLLIASWIYDINYNRSFQIIHKNEYIEKIFSVLPETKNTRKIYSKLKEHLNEKCSSPVK